MFFVKVDEIDIASYADDNTPHTVGHTPEMMNKLETVCKKLFKWFSENGMKANPTKFSFLSSLETNTQIYLDECNIKNSASQNLLGVTIDKKLNFNKHLSNFCDKASKKKTL